MEPDPVNQLYQHPLLANSLLLLIPGLSYWYMRTHLVSYGRDIAHPTDNATLFFYTSFWLFPLVNLLFSLRALLYADSRLAGVYALLSVLSFLGAWWVWPEIGFQKVGG